MSATDELKECFVLMPIEDKCMGYEDGHFKDVYEAIIKPSLADSGFKSVRADEIPGSDDVQLAVIDHLIKDPLVICDISAFNPKISIGLGIRHAYKKPVILLQDSKAPHLYYIEGTECIEYPRDLQLETVQEIIHKLQQTICVVCSN